MEDQSHPEMIRVFDSYGRELHITRQEWREKILPGDLESHWDEPESLYSIVVQSLDDGFVADVLEAARHLHSIDPIPERGTCILGIALMKLGNLSDAEKVLTDFLRKRGDSGVVLTNLAKVYAAQGQQAKAEKTLWHALETDPNQDNGLEWYAAIQHEQGGDQAYLQALSRISRLPGSWRAQLWLAREALQNDQLGDAISLYRECLERVSPDVPSDVLMQMSGDLGNAGHLVEILELVEPHYFPETHGLAVGNNLIRAHLELGEFDKAKQLVDHLYGFQRPDWQETLNYWDSAISDSRLAQENEVSEDGIKATLLSVVGPIWFNPNSAVASLFPQFAEQASEICFLGSTASRTRDSTQIVMQRTDTLGRLSRALPLFFAEQVQFNLRLQSRTLVPWIVEPSGGFLFGGAPWTDQTASEYSAQAASNSQWIVAIHLDATSSPWTVCLRLIDVKKNECLDQITESFTDEASSVSRMSLRLSSRLQQTLRTKISANTRLPPKAYAVADIGELAEYLLRLEQILAVRCAAMDPGNASFLSGEREILNGTLQLCVAHPQSVCLRVLLMETLRYMSKARPGIPPEFQSRIRQLQSEFPLPEQSQQIVNQLLEDLTLSTS